MSCDASQVDARNVDGSTPLCDACSAGSLECVRLLLEHGAKANPALTSRTASPLHEACMGGECLCLLHMPLCFSGIKFTQFLMANMNFYEINAYNTTLCCLCFR